MRLVSLFVGAVIVMTVVLLPVGVALAQQANPSRVLPQGVQRGETFNVTVTFTSPANKFHFIYFLDFVPDGWNVTVHKRWCTPDVNGVSAKDNMAEIYCSRFFDNGTAFTWVYKVTVPDDAELGIHSFAGLLRYYIASRGPYLESITGDCEVEVILPVISFSPASFSFSAIQGEGDPPGQILDISNLGEETVNWTLDDDADWLNQNITSGSLAGNEHDYVEVSVEIAGLAVGMYSANITGEAPNATNTTWKIPVTLEIKPPTTIDVIRDIDDTLRLPGMLCPGDTFEVLVNWTAPVNNFTSISLSDVAPDGFEVEVNVTWCSPNADKANATGSKAEIAWFEPYDKGTNFTAMYKVTVPSTAAPGSHFFPYNNCSLSWLEYCFGEDGPYTSCTMGDSEVMVTVLGNIVGETRDVNANLLVNVTVALYRDSSELGSDISTPNYSMMAYVTGQYWLLATKDGFYEINMTNMSVLPDLYINLTTPELLAAGYTFDFEGDYGLVPTACNVSYAMESVNLWLSPPPGHPEWGLSGWKAMDSVHAWLYPT